MPIFSLISKFLELIDRIQTLVNKLWIRLTEEWMFLEGKFTIIGTFVLIKVLLIVGILRFSFPISLGFDSLLQSFVSLLAIVPAISLAVMEISASSYSIKLSRIYRKNVYFWYLIVLYITVIIISIFGQLYSSLSMLNTMTTILAIFGILYIVPFFLAIMRLLEPKRAIESLGQQVKVESILSTISQKPISLIPPSGDPLYPLLEIALEAVNRMDIETLRLTLDETLKRYSKVLIALERERPGRKATAGEVLIEAKVTHQMREVIEHFLNHLRSLKSVSFERKYEQNVICLVEYFGRFCEETMNYRFIEASHGNNRPAFSWMYEIVDFGTKCLVVGFWDGSACSLRVLSELSEKAIRQRYSGLQHAIADFVKELSTNGMRIPHLPMHFVPSVALHSMSSVVVAKMKYGVYDVELNHQIEDFNKLSLEII